MVTIHDGLRKLKEQLGKDRIQEIKGEIERYAEKKKYYRKAKDKWGVQKSLSEFTEDGKIELAHLLIGGEIATPTGKLLETIHKDLVGTYEKGESFESYKELKTIFAGRFRGRHTVKFIKEYFPIEQESTWEERLRRVGLNLIQYLKLTLSKEQLQRLLDDYWCLFWLFEGYREKGFDLSKKYKVRWMVGPRVYSFVQHKTQYNEKLLKKIGGVEVPGDLKDKLRFNMKRYEKWYGNVLKFIWDKGGALFFAQMMPELISKRKDKLVKTVQETEIMPVIGKKAGHISAEHIPEREIKALQRITRDDLKDLTEEETEDQLEPFLEDFKSTIKTKLKRRLGGRAIKMNEIAKEIIESNEIEEFAKEVSDGIFGKLTDALGNVSGDSPAGEAANKLVQLMHEEEERFNKAIQKSIESKIKEGLKEIWKDEYREVWKWRYKFLDKVITILGELLLIMAMLVKAWSIEENVDVEDYGFWRAYGKGWGKII